MISILAGRTGRRRSATEDSIDKICHIKNSPILSVVIEVSGCANAVALFLQRDDAWADEIVGVVADTPIAADYVLQNENYKGKMKIVEERYGEADPYYWGAFVFLGDPGKAGGKGEPE